MNRGADGSPRSSGKLAQAAQRLFLTGGSPATTLVRKTARPFTRTWVDTQCGPQWHHDHMGTFDIHSDILELPELQGPAGLAAHGLWYRCGMWTATHGRTGFVPQGIARELFGGDDATIERLIRAGLWEVANDGYRMLRGPSSDPDQPLPLWRYSDDDLDGRLFARDDTPNT